MRYLVAPITKASNRVLLDLLSYAEFLEKSKINKSHPLIILYGETEWSDKNLFVSLEEEFYNNSFRELGFIGTPIFYIEPTENNRYVAIRAKRSFGEVVSIKKAAIGNYSNVFQNINSGNYLAVKPTSLSSREENIKDGNHSKKESTLQ